MKSRPVRALWIEITNLANKRCGIKSRPVRALWIEISSFPSFVS